MPLWRVAKCQLPELTVSKYRTFPLTLEIQATRQSEDYPTFPRPDPEAPSSLHLPTRTKQTEPEPETKVILSLVGTFIFQKVMLTCFYIFILGIDVIAFYGR